MCTAIMVKVHGKVLAGMRYEWPTVHARVCYRFIKQIQDTQKEKWLKKIA
jgi:hypothetical protein